MRDRPRTASVAADTPPGRAAPVLSLLAMAAAFVFACAPQEPRSTPAPPPLNEVVYADDDTLFPRILFADGQVSLNDRCMVRHVKMNLKMPPTYVNGRPVGFC